MYALYRTLYSNCYCVSQNEGDKKKIQTTKKKQQQQNNQNICLKQMFAVKIVLPLTPVYVLI